jgi:hypothetical protein
MFGLIVSLSLLAAIPAVSAARSGHHARHHSRHARIEHFRRHQDVRSQTGSQDAGTVQSFQNGTLTIKLTDGSTVSGAVTPDTEVECQSMNDNFIRADGHGDNGGSDDNGGGDDNGNGANCMTALQTPGTPVLDATLKLTSAGAVWDRVDLDS